jgi:hypothetical protein
MCWLLIWPKPYSILDYIMTTKRYLGIQLA